jgi:hypothetical protein
MSWNTRQTQAEVSAHDRGRIGVTDPTSFDPNPDLPRTGLGNLPFYHPKFAWKRAVVARHPMAEAIGYALSQWQELNAFSRDGAVSIDNNVSEREMKRVVLNRKNSLFVGNPRGGRTAAILASLTTTCRRHDVDPQLYLTQLLINLPTTSATELPPGFPINGSSFTQLSRRSDTSRLHPWFT